MPLRHDPPAPRAPPPAAGPSAVIDDIVGGVADRAVEYVNDHQTVVHVPVGPLQPTVDTYTPYVDRAAGAPGTYPDTTAHGAAYYFGMLAFPDKCVPLPVRVRLTSGRAPTRTARH